MRKSFFETHVNLAFFIVGAMIGILGGLLSDFCLISFYRWFDFFQSETRVHPNTIPISIDFWIFLLCVITLIGLTYFFYCILIKFVDIIKSQQENKELPKNSPFATTKIESVIPPSDAVDEAIEKKSYCIVIGCFKKNSTLFAIPAAIATMITLIQVFAIFLLGENWLTIILTSPFGFLILILIIVSLFGATAFTYYLLGLIFIDFFYKVIKNKNIQFTVILIASIFMCIGLLAIGSIYLYLVLAWFAKSELLTSLLGLFFIFIFSLFLFIILIGYYWRIHTQSRTCFWKALTFTAILFLLCIVVIFSITIFQGLSMVNDEMSKYHSDKMIIVKFNGDVVNRDTKTPVVLLLNKTNDAGLTKNFSFLDETYAQCHWSTNYGYFFTITSNNSLIKRQLQELIIPGCGNQKDKTYWTYDIEDYGKNKPPVIIGLIVEDSIKKGKNSFGEDRILLNWTSTDTVDINYNVTNFGSPF